MIILDVTVLVAAFHDGSPDHDSARAYLEAAVNGPEPVGISDAIAMGVVRVLTHPKIFSSPATVEQALASVQGLLDHPSVHLLPTTSRQWGVTAGLVRAARAREAWWPTPRMPPMPSATAPRS